MNKNLLILGFVFFFTFFWFSWVQQFLTSYYQSIWYDNAWFYSLLLIYGGFLIWSLFLVWFIRKIGSRKSIMFSTWFYGLFIFSLLGDSLILLYILSFFIWMSASFLWIWQQSYIILTLKWKNIWKAIWIINFFTFLWASLGTIILWFLIWLIWYRNAFLIFWFLPFISMPIAYFLMEQNEDFSDKKINIGIMLQYFKNTDLLKLWFFSLSLNFTAGLFFSIVPLHIKDALGITYVWIITALYYIIVMMLSYIIWKYIDKYDNRKIIFCMFLLWIFSMIMLFFYKIHYSFIFIWVVTLSLMFATYTPLIWSIITLISSKNNIKYFSSFFMTCGNLWLVLWVLFASYFYDNRVYFIGWVLIFFSLISYYTIYKKSFSCIKKYANIEKK